MDALPDPVIRPLTDTADALGEGPVWHEATGAVTWVDIEGRAVHRLEFATGRRDRYPMPDRPSAAVPAGDGRLLVCLARALALFDPARGRLEEVARLEAPAGHRFNDAKCDPAGRLWVASMNEATFHPTGALYRFDRRGLAAVEGGIAIGNSLAWSPDGGTLYLASTPERVIRAYAFSVATGEIGARRDLVRVDGEAAMPDGAATDDEGALWSAQWDGWRLVRYAPDGRVLRRLPMPVSRPTSCCFGGPDRRTLFVTSSARGLGPGAASREPRAGALFAVALDVAGPVPPPFRP